MLHPRPPAHKKKHGHGAAVFLFFLAAGVAAFAGMSYRQRTSVLRESLGKVNHHHHHTTTTRPRLLLREHRICVPRSSDKLSDAPDDTC